MRSYNHKLGSSAIGLYAARALQLPDMVFPRCLHGQPLLLPRRIPRIRQQLMDWFEEQRVVPQVVGEFDDSALTGYQLKFNLRNSGCVNAADGTLQTVWNYRRFAYGPSACAVATTSPTQTGSVSGGAPGHRITNLTGTLYGLSDIERFQVRLDNITANTSGYVWLALEDNLSPMNVVSVRDLTTNTTLPLLSYGDGKWVKIATSFAGGASRLLEIAVTYDNCSDNAMRVIMGWDCNSYPTSPGTYGCVPLEVFSTLRLLPKRAAIQGNFVATSAIPATLCQDFRPCTSGCAVTFCSGATPSATSRWAPTWRG